MFQVAALTFAFAFDSVLRPRQLFLKIHDLFDLRQKPAINLREVENLLDGEAGAQGVAATAFWLWAFRGHAAHGNQSLCVWLPQETLAGEWRRTPP